MICLSDSHTAHEFVRKSQQLATFGSNSLERLENFVDNFEEYLTLGSRLGDVLTAIVAGSKFEVSEMFIISLLSVTF